MSKDKHFLSLNKKLAIMLILSALFGVLGYYLSDKVGTFAIETLYLSDQNVTRRNEDNRISFINFCSENNVSSTDINKFSNWARSVKDVYLTIYEGNAILYESGWQDEEESQNDEKSTDSISNSLDMTQGELSNQAHLYSPGEFDINLKDGIFVVSIIDYSEVEYYTMLKYGSLVIGIFFFAASAMLYIVHLTRRVTSLSEDFDIVSKGSLTYKIEEDENDELSSLAKNADLMRHSLIKLFQEQREAREANSEIITSMSHDMRTPLTSLIGYLDILLGDEDMSKKKKNQYLSVCKSKALQLKDLSDEMFQYFLVFGKENMDLKMEVYDFVVLMEQMLFEPLFGLEQNGFDVEKKFSILGGNICVDVNCLVRIFNNIFSNIEKYASKEYPITVDIYSDRQFFYISFVNKVKKDDANFNSTNIGIKTCMKITEQMGGYFACAKDDDENLFGLYLSFKKNT